jgi:putative hydrolase of the HAD superfamily
VKLPLPRAALIDLDGTIIDAVESALESWTTACAPASIRLSLDAELLFQAIDARRARYWEDPLLAPVGRMDLRAATRIIVQQALEDLGVADSELAFEIADGFRDRRDRFRLIDGSIDTLKALCSAGVRLALITNGAGHVQRGKVEQFGLAPYFEHVLIEGELGFGKPDERVYRHALDSLGVTAADAWIVGDDLEWEVAAPQKLGLYTVWVRGSLMGSPNPIREGVVPDRIIASLAELLAISS